MAVDNATGAVIEALGPGWDFSFSVTWPRGFGLKTYTLTAAESWAKYTEEEAISLYLSEC